MRTVLWKVPGPEYPAHVVVAHVASIEEGDRGTVEVFVVGRNGKIVTDVPIETVIRSFLAAATRAEALP